MAAVLAERRAKPAARSAGGSTEDDATRAYPVPEVHRAAEPETRVLPRPRLQPPAKPETKVQPIPQLRPPAGPEARPGPPPADQPAPAQTAARPMVTRLPARRRYRGRLAAVVAIAAAIITAAIVLPLSVGGGRITPAEATAVIPLHATTAARLHGDGAATGRATARQNASGSWTISLTVTHLKRFGRQPVVHLLVREPKRSGDVRWHVPGAGRRELDLPHDQRRRPARLPHHGDHARTPEQERRAGRPGHPQRPDPIVAIRRDGHAAARPWRSAPASPSPTPSSATDDVSRNFLV